MIRALHCQNFLSLENTGVELRPFNVIIGPNGSGKSNLLLAFNFLTRCAQGAPLSQVLTCGGGYSAIVTRSERERSVSLRVEFDVREHRFDYELDFNEIRVEREVLSVDGSLELLNRQREHLKHQEPRDGGGPSSTTGPIGRWESALGKYVSPHHGPLTHLARQELASWGFHRFSPDVMRAEGAVRREESIDYDGANLAPVLLTLATSNRQRFEQLLATLRKWLPELEDITTELTPDARVVLGVSEKGLPVPLRPARVSDGYLGLIATVTALLQPTPPTVLFLEEPENFVHVRLLDRLVALLREASPETQVVLTTHSPYVVDRIQPEDLILAEKVNGVSRFQPLGNVDAVRKHLSTEFSLGEMWFSGLLGAVP